VILWSAHILSVSLIFAMLVGFGMMITMAASNTVLQTISDDDKRGRVMSFYTMSFMGTSPLGSLLGGYMANTIGVSLSYLVFGISAMVGSGIFALKLPALISQIHASSTWKNSQTQIASGIKNATELSVPSEE
jgi:MFS family permease